MRTQYIGCTIYFHTSKRYSIIHFAPTSSWNVPSFCGWHQPVLVRSGTPGNPVGRAMGPAPPGVPGTPGNPAGRAMGAAPTGIPVLVLETPRIREIMSLPIAPKSTWRPNLPILGGIAGFRNGLGTGVGRGVGIRGGVGAGNLVGGRYPNWGSASTMETKAARARITCQIKIMIFSFCKCTVLSVGWILLS